jgi:nitroimidazol reductase NimA-like FMN-containing flavoprotein (pyridoxamine 5'-phosphate oxidase superfamily)
MRRHEKEIFLRSDIDAVIHGCQICHLAMAMDNRPYVVPISFGYDGTHLFFHSALEGLKIEYLKANPQVCFQMERGVKLVTAASGPCHWTFHFESVVGHGTAAEMRDAADKRYGLDQIVVHYRGAGGDYSEAALSALSVWRITIDALTGKRSPVVK